MRASVMDLQSVVGGPGTSLAVVVSTHDGEAIVRVGSGAVAAELPCDVLRTSDAPLTLAAGDRVLCVQVHEARGVILGRIGPSHAPEPERAAEDVPDELVLEAKQQLTLRVGDGSITIRADGKILIKGKDLVSHAQRTNRIRGGSVAIN